MTAVVTPFERAVASDASLGAAIPEAPRWIVTPLATPGDAATVRAPSARSAAEAFVADWAKVHCADWDALGMEVEVSRAGDMGPGALFRVRAQLRPTVTAVPMVRRAGA